MAAGICQVDYSILVMLKMRQPHETWQNRYYHTFLAILQLGAWLLGHVLGPSLELSALVPPHIGLMLQHLRRHCTPGVWLEKLPCSQLLIPFVDINVIYCKLGTRYQQV